MAIFPWENKKKRNNKKKRKKKLTIVIPTHPYISTGTQIYLYKENIVISTGKKTYHTLKKN